MIASLRVPILAGLATGILIALVVAGPLGATPPAQGLTALPIHTGDLRLLEDAPYDVLEPEWLPGGMELVTVSVLGPPETSGGVFSVDMRWADDSGNDIHVWQTNMTEMIGTQFDPVAGTRVDVAGAEWRSLDHEIFEQVRHVMSTRLAGDLTLSVDTNLDQSVLESVIASLK